jgi:hypothetical protein
VVFSADEATHVGRESGSPVTPDYPARVNDFTGEIRWGADRCGRRTPVGWHLVDGS